MTEACLQLSRLEALRAWLPCDLNQVRPAALQVSDFLRKLGLQEAAVSACELALVEACNNAVQYAAGDMRRQRIVVDVLCEGAVVELQIRDHTNGFEWPAGLDLPPPDQERGRGIFLIQNLMDETHYLRGAGANCLILRKRVGGSWKEKASGLQSSLDLVSHQLRESEQIISDMAEELSFCYESLSAIFRCSVELGRTHDLQEFSQRLLSDLAQITSADWFILRLVSRDGTKLSGFTASEAGLDLPELELSGHSSVISLERQSALRRQDVWFDGDPVLKPADPLTALGAGSTGLIHPFLLGDQLIGTVAIGKSAGRSQFTAVHANVVHTFADFLGIQIANVRFQEEQVHARVMSRELEIAHTIQRSLLPKSLPTVPGHELAGFCQSARQVGGDFYDVLKLDDESLLLIVADVMGKGIPASMFAAILRSLLRAAPEWTDQPGHLLERVNRLLFQELSGVDMFITAQVVFVDTAGKRMIAASAGHCPMLLANGSEPEIKMLAPEGLPLGILPDTSFGAHVEELAPRSRLLLYTDGVTEARNAEGDFFGHERLMAWFQRSLQPQRSADQLKTELADELRRFQGTTALRDDQTFLIMA